MKVERFVNYWVLLKNEWICCRDFKEFCQLNPIARVSEVRTVYYKNRLYDRMETKPYKTKDKKNV